MEMKEGILCPLPPWIVGGIWSCLHPLGRGRDRCQTPMGDPTRGIIQPERSATPLSRGLARDSSARGGCFTTWGTEGPGRRLAYDWAAFLILGLMCVKILATCLADKVRLAGGRFQWQLLWDFGSGWQSAERRLRTKGLWGWLWAQSLGIWDRSPAARRNQPRGLC